MQMLISDESSCLDFYGYCKIKAIVYNEESMLFLSIKAVAQIVRESLGKFFEFRVFRPLLKKAICFGELYFDFVIQLS